ncbi:MAG: prepilin-type N-terminal cleavage/methylation domain-containing protein [Desulfobacteraceae bacterium]|nr:prepilin-type N-terminal cleavage/methylation domain-containing protein [Desulfobacteraceae bacterium]
MDLKKDSNGFTLVEVMIALVILSIGILGIASMNVSSVQGNGYALNLTSATNIGQEIIEEMMKASYFDTNYFTDQNGDGQAGLVNTGGAADYSWTKTVEGTLFTAGWNISPLDPINDTNTIQINITWIEKNQNRVLSMTYMNFDII